MFSMFMVANVVLWMFGNREKARSGFRGVVATTGDSHQEG